MSAPSPQIINAIALIPARKLADAWGFEGPTNSFREMCAKMGVKPVRPGWYDPRHIRQRMDAVQGITAPAAPSPPVLSLVEQRKARNGKA